MVLKICNGVVISEGKINQNKSVYISDGKIIAVTEKELHCDKQIDAEQNYVSAGFIDIHVHGGGGSDFSDGGVRPIVTAADFHAIHGTTTIVPTLPAAEPAQMISFLTDVKAAMEMQTAKANIFGAHLEGPYLSPEQCGALDVRYMRPPQETEYRGIVQEFEGVLKRWTFAPEHQGSIAFYDYMKSRNIVGSIGHSNAVFDDVKRVYDRGCKLATHLYSAMSTVTRHCGFRNLGVVESALLLDDMDVEIIADLKHLPPELIRLIYKIKGAEYICLVTDAMRGAGMPDGPSLLGCQENGTPCIIEDGVAKLTDRSAFAGSVATADRLIRGCVGEAGIDIASAVKMMTINPARIMKMESKGDIKEGLDADIIFFDRDINIKRVMIMGKTQYA